MDSVGDGYMKGGASRLKVGDAGWVPGHPSPEDDDGWPIGGGKDF